MAITQSNSPSHSPQTRAKSTPTPAQTTTLVEQQLRLSVESPQLLAAIDPSSPGQDRVRRIEWPAIERLRSTNSRADQNEADAWAIGIALAEDSLQRIKPCPHLLVRYFHQLEHALKTAKAVQL
jgi:hypothetical protein